MVNILIVTGRKYGMEINIEKSHLLRVSRIQVGNRELKRAIILNILEVF